MECKNKILFTFEVFAFGGSNFKGTVYSIKECLNLSTKCTKTYGNQRFLDNLYVIKLDNKQCRQNQILMINKLCDTLTLAI